MSWKGRRARSSSSYLSGIHSCAGLELCVSSRPWRIFTEAFRGVPSVRLQDLTARDMTRFITARLSSTEAIKQLLVTDSDRTHRLVELMLHKTGGVFLWVSLAVQAIEPADAVSMDAIEAKIQSSPSDLDTFYRHRLKDDSPAKYEMSRIFQLLRARQEVAAFTRHDESSVLSVWQLYLSSADPRDK